MDKKLYEQCVAKKTPSIFASCDSGDGFISLYCVCCPEDVLNFFSALGEVTSVENGVVIVKIKSEKKDFITGIFATSLAKNWGVEVYISLSDVECNSPIKEVKEQQTKPSNTESLLDKVIELHNSTPDGQIQDADTILSDIFDELKDECADGDLTGFSDELFGIWKNSKDKESVEKMFELFTGVSFENYLLRCQEEITRKEVISEEKETDFPVDDVFKALISFMPENIAQDIVSSIKNEISKNDTSVDDGVLVDTPLGPMFMKKVYDNSNAGLCDTDSDTDKCDNIMKKTTDSKKVPIFYLAVASQNHSCFAETKVKTFSSQEMNKVLEYVSKTPDVISVTTSFGAKYSPNEFLQKRGNLTCLCRAKTMDLLKNEGKCFDNCPFGPKGLQLCGRLCQVCGHTTSFTEYDTIFCEKGCMF